MVDGERRAAQTTVPAGAGIAAAETRARAAGSPRLTFGRKLAYGVGDMAGSASATIMGFFLTAFLLDTVGLRPGLLALIFLIGQAWDAVIDPLIGVLSDRTRSRWGRKRPWLLVGAVPFGLAYALLWAVPNLGPAGLFWYYLTIILLLRAASSAVGVPYAALSAEMTRDYDERTLLTTYRSILNLIASLVAVILHPVLVGLAAPDVALGHLLSGAVWGVFVVLTVLAAFAWTFELPGEHSARPLGLRELAGEMFHALRSGPFRMVLGVAVCSWLVIILVQNNLLLFIRYWAQVESHFTGIILAFQVAVILTLRPWAWVCARVGKQRTYIAGAGLWAAALLALFFAPRGAPLPYYLASAVIGVGAAVAYLVPWSMLPDVVEHDELEHGARREGAFFGVFLLIQQIGLSLGLAASNLALEAAGYINAAAGQPEGVLLTLRLLVSVVPCAILIASLPFALRYPISRERFAAIRAELERRAR